MKGAFMKLFKTTLIVSLLALILVSCEKNPNHTTICDLSMVDVEETLYVGMLHSELLSAMGYPSEYDPLIDVDTSYVVEKNHHYRWTLTDGNTLDIMMKIGDDSFCGTSMDAFHVSEIRVSSPSGDEVYKQLCRPLDLQNLPEGFWLSQAKDSGLVVHENGHVTSGEDSFAYFLAETEKGKPATVYLADYYTLLDPSHYDPDYYESIKDDYPMLFISELTFDGERYHHIQYENGKKLDAVYRCLNLSYQYKNPTEPNDTEITLVYMLADDPETSHSDWFHGIVSSQIGDFVHAWPIYKE